MGVIFLPLAIASAFAVESPECIANPTGVPKGEEEAAVAKVTAHLTDEEMIVRLVYAEALASECPDPSVAAPGIAWTILNRVRDEGKPGRAIVTARQQYRSTMGSCDVARRKEFLCPAPGPLWAVATRSTTTARENAGNPLPGVKNYFFPKAFDRSRNCAAYRGKYPAWATSAKEVVFPAGGPSGESACVRYYRLGSAPTGAITPTKIDHRVKKKGDPDDSSAAAIRKPENRMDEAN